MPPSDADALTLTPLEAALIAELRLEPRATNRSLGAKLGVGEVVVAARIRGLEQRGVMRITAKQDFHAAGYTLRAMLHLNVRGRSPRAVARDFVKYDRVGAVSVMAGMPSVILVVYMEDMDALKAFVLNVVSATEGVEDCETSIIAEVIKSNTEFSSAMSLDP